MDIYSCLACNERMPASARNKHDGSKHHTENVMRFISNVNSSSTADTIPNPVQNIVHNPTQNETAAHTPTTASLHRSYVIHNSTSVKKPTFPNKAKQKAMIKISSQQNRFNKRNANTMPTIVVHNRAYQAPETTLPVNLRAPIDSDRNAAINDKLKPNDFSHKLYVTGYPPYIRANDLLRAFSRFGPVHCDRRTARAAVLGFTSIEQAEKAVAAASNGVLNVCGTHLQVRWFVPERDPIAPMKQKDRVLVVPPEDLDLTGEFEEQATALLARVRLTREEVERLVVLYADVERALHPIWPGCHAVPFGSITTGLGTKASDADCFVEVPGGPPGSAVNRARRMLQQWPRVFVDVVAIPRASTPIVKLLHVPTSTKCDLSFKTPLGALNSRLLAHLLHRAPVLPRVAVLLKYWANVHALSGTGRLTNYALVLLLIHYLQQRTPSLLPAVAALQQDPVHARMIDNWNAGFDERITPFPPTEDTLADLFGGFFEYYAAFEFERYVVCPYLGRPLERTLFLRPEELSDEFALYRRNILHEIEPPLRIETPWCVQDPFVHCHNVTSGVSAHLAADLLAYIRFAAIAYAEERESSHRGLLRRLLLERPQLARRATIAQFNIQLKPRTLDAAGSDWRERVRRATFDVFERIFCGTLTEVQRTTDDNGRDREEYTVLFERNLWRQRKQRRPRGAADLPFLEREIATSTAMTATMPLIPCISFQLVIKFGPKQKVAACVSIRLVEGDVVAFRELGSYLLSVGQSWYAKLLGLDKERTKRKNEKVDAAEKPIGEEDEDIDLSAEESESQSDATALASVASAAISQSLPVSAAQALLEPLLRSSSADPVASTQPMEVVSTAESPRESPPKLFKTNNDVTYSLEQET